MTNQRFYAPPTDTTTWPNGAVGHHAFCLGPYAKVRACPIAGTGLRLTVYATGYTDSYFSIPACTQHRNKYIAGFLTCDEQGPIFHPAARHADRLPLEDVGVLATNRNFEEQA